MKKRKTTRNKPTLKGKLFGTKIVDTTCKVCNGKTKGTENMIVTCWRCVQNLVGQPEQLKKLEENKITRLRGWKFMKIYVDPDGTVYEFGVENPSLKGKYKPTNVEKIQEERKKKREDLKRKKEILKQKKLEERKKAKKKSSKK